MESYQNIKKQKKRTVIILSFILIAGSSWGVYHNFGQIAFTIAKHWNYTLLASTVVNGDRVELWKQSTDDPYFWKFLMVATTPTGQFLDVTMGQFNSSGRPFYQNQRYMALAASNFLCLDETFFVYDAQVRQFNRYSAWDHVHPGFVIQDHNIYFSSCKTPQPVIRIDMMTGEERRFGDPAPQGASFYVQNGKVLIQGTDGLVYEIGQERLVPSSISLKDHSPTANDFQSICLVEEYLNP